jgi:hypothetical protein
MVTGEIADGAVEAFLDASSAYNEARARAGLPTYRRLIRTDHGDANVVVFVAEFADVAAIDAAEAVVAGEEFRDMVTNMYRHLVPGSVGAATYRDV